MPLRRAVPSARTSLARAAPALVAALLLAPATGRADLRLLEADLELPAAALAPGPHAAGALAAPITRLAQAGTPAAASPLDFDLLPPPAAIPAADPSLARRRTLLNWHQGAGIGLLALTVATVVVGQLNYNDRFAGARPSTGKYIAPHAFLATTTLLTFGATGGLALFAPAPPRREGFDRVTLHKLAMFTAAAGMLAEGALGVWTQQREGYLNQPTVAKAHLVLGYVVLSAVTAGVAAIVL